MSLKIQILESGEYLDLFPGELFGLNYQVYDLGSIETRAGTFSNDFSVPNTAHNKAALGNVTQTNVLQSPNRVFDAIPAQCYQNGIQVSKGFIQVVETLENEGAINLCFYGDNIDVFELLKDKNLTDLDFSEFTHTYNAANIIASFSNTSGYIYPVCDYGLFEDRASATINQGEIFPAIYIHNVLSKIFNAIGYKLDGTLLNRALYKKSFLPFTQGTFGYTAEFAGTKSFYVKSDTAATKFSLPNGTTALFNFQQKIPGFLGNDLFNLTTDTYTATHPYKIQLSFLITQVGGSVFVPTLRILKNGITISISGLGGKRISATTTVQAGDTIQFQCESNGGGTSTFYGYGQGLVLKDFVSGMEMDPTVVMPDMLQTDFLKFILFRFQGVMSVDPFTKTVYLNQFNDIKNKPSEDWSDKVDISKEVKTNYFDVLEGYAKINNALYSIDSEDKYQAEYNSNNIIPFGGGTFTLENDFLEGETTVFETPFSPTMVIESFGNNKILLPYIPRYLNPADTTNVNVPEPRILTMYGSISLDQISEITSMSILGTTVSEIPFSYFYKSQYGSDVDTVKDSLAFGVQAGIFAPNDLGAFESDYLYLITILQNPEIKRAYLRLNQIDMVNLDFLKKKYFERFGGYFYLNIIENYDGSGNSVECELIKI
jgi:hypothetical protein